VYNIREFAKLLGITKPYEYGKKGYNWLKTDTGGGDENA